MEIEETRKCYFCDIKTERRKISFNGGWGDYRLLLIGVLAFVCPECGYTIFSLEDAQVIENFSKAFYDLPEKYRPEAILISKEEGSGLFLVQCPTFNISLEGKTAQEIASSYLEEMKFLEQSYKDANDEELTVDAKELKKRLLKIAEEGWSIENPRCSWCQCPTEEHSDYRECMLFGGNLICDVCCDYETLSVDAKTDELVILKVINKLTGKVPTEEEIEDTCRQCNQRKRVKLIQKSQ